MGNRIGNLQMVHSPGGAWLEALKYWISADMPKKSVPNHLADGGIMANCGSRGRTSARHFLQKTPHFTRHLHHSQFLVMVFGGETLQFWGLNMP